MNKDINLKLDNILRRLDSLTFNHSVRVMMIASEVENYIGVTDHKLMTAALFHDIGKLYTPFNILDKVDRLTSLERELIDLHSYVGYKLLADMGVSEDICRIILYHHGFKPITLSDVGYYDNDTAYNYSVMLHTIDSFEALTSDRPYHRGLTGKDAMKIMEREDNYEKRTLEYLKSVSFNDDGTSVVNRSSHAHEESLSNIIMGMEF